VNEKETYSGMCDEKVFFPKEGRIAVSCDDFEWNLKLF
jgi:hypothetical protein